MKKFTKLCLMVSLVCVCIAALCFGAGIAMGSGMKDVANMADNGELNIGNWHIGDSQFYWGPKEEDSVGQEVEGRVNVSFPEMEVENLNVDVKYGEVHFVDSDSDEIKVNIDAPKRNSYECKNDNGTLKLKDKTSSFKWHIRNKDNVTVTIEIPKGKEFKEAKLITNAGTIDIEHMLVAKEEISIDVGAGEVTAEEFATKDLEVDCGVGEAMLKGVVEENVSADCGVGEITLILQGKEEDYDYDISCGVGTVNINGTSYSSLSTDEEINNQAGRKISLDCGVGEIDVKVEED